MKGYSGNLSYLVNWVIRIPNQKKVQAITDFPPPKSAKCLLGFLGSLNFYRRALPNTRARTVADTLQPLYDTEFVRRLLEVQFEIKPKTAAKRDSHPGRKKLHPLGKIM